MNNAPVLKYFILNIEDLIFPLFQADFINLKKY